MKNVIIRMVIITKLMFGLRFKELALHGLFLFFSFLNEHGDSSREKYVLLYEKEESRIGDGFCSVRKGKCTLL